MTRALVDPRKLGRLTGALFTQSVQVQQFGTSVDSTGQRLESWSNVPGFTRLPCRISALFAPSSRMQAQERKLLWGTVTEADRLITMPGSFIGAITTPMRLLATDGNTYDILSVEVDGTGSYTRIFARTVSL